MADRDEQTKAQFRNPNGDEGRKVLESMNDHHAAVAGSSAGCPTGTLSPCSSESTSRGTPSR